tara:strand:- start:2770 stop:3693 length:924 start_codon:yes stop_codon:yes gene_type:complete
MKVLVVGSKGFLGSWVKKMLLTDTNHEILEISGKESLDITKIEDLQNFVSKHKPEAIINCAAFVGGISYGYKYPARLLYENSKIALNLYEISRKNDVGILINPISNCAYPGHLTTYVESQFFDGPPHESVYNYGIAKRLSVDLGNGYFEQYKFSSANVVLSNMYGPEDHFDIERSHALGALVKKICDAKINNIQKVEIWGSGKPIREWLYVQDGANALIKSLDLEKGHHFFNVGVQKGISIIDLANTIKKIVNWDGEFFYNADKPDGVYEKKVDGSKGESKLNWMPDIDLEYGIEKTVEWYMVNYGK